MQKKGVILSKIFLIGGNRGLGKSILSESYNHDYELISMSRNTKNNYDKNKKLSLVKGDATIKKDIEKNISNSTTVISTINVMRKNIFPWSKITNSKTTISDTVKNLIEICKYKKISRVIFISAWGTYESKKQLPFWFSNLIKYSNLRYPYEDHERQEEMIVNSGLNWTIIRPVALINFQIGNNVKTYFDDYPKYRLIVSRKNVAKFIFRIINKKEFFGKKVIISN